MRHIRAEQFRPSADWRTRATAAQARIDEIAAPLTAAGPEEAKRIYREIRIEIDRHAHLWSEIKEALKSLSGGKCWYCEGKVIRSHMAVDHFRPKNGVAECGVHPGYWWLALDWQNYRYACTYCNSLLRDEEAGETFGKGTHFPLVDEERRAFEVTDVNGECPGLLDPLVAADPRLLWFMDDGQAAPRYSREKSALFFRRADVSIRVYNLNESDIADARSFIAFEIKHQVQRGDKYLDAAETGDASALDHFEEVCRVLLGLIGPEAEFSAAARAFLAAYRDKDWVEDALRTA